MREMSRSDFIAEESSDADSLADHFLATLILPLSIIVQNFKLRAQVVPAAR